MPSVSVITSAFNAASTIRRACESVLAQTYSDWEYLMVDDGSSDNTADLVATYLDPRFRPAVRTPNRGPGAALNTGIRHAAGEFIAFLDADDEYLPDHLETHVEAMRRDPKIDLLWGGVELIVKEESQGWIPDLVRGSGLIHVSECVVQGTLFARRQLFDRILFSEDRSIWYQDYDLVERAKVAQVNCQRFLLPTYRYYRDSGQSIVDRVKAAWA